MRNSFPLSQVPITTGVRLAVGTPSPSKADLLGVHDERHPQNQQQILSQQSSHDEHKSASTAALLHQKSDVSEAAAAVGGSKSGKGAAVKNVASPVTAASKKAGDVAAVTKGIKTSATADEHHDVGSGVKASAASLAHAAEHLKEATVMLQKKAVAEGAGKGVVAVAVANGTASAKKPIIKDSTPPPDLLAYSKKQGQPGDTIHVLFTSNGRQERGEVQIIGRVCTGIASWYTQQLCPGYG